MLKPETVARLLPARHRTRAVNVLADPIILDVYAPALHGLDFLLRLWARLAEQRHELYQIFGPWAQSPTQFATVMGTNAEILVLHREGAQWTAGEGLVAVAHLDDVEGICRARVHYWVVPEYRHPRVTPRLGKMVIDYLFEVRGLYNLWGLTAVHNGLALRFAKRLGFECGRIWEKAVLWEQQPVDAVQTNLSRSQWQARRAT